ncbi:MAG TPA: type I-B CRISPR-associated protein Cas7/Csh2 [Bacteroidales bacterium]|nr:type I-B CRISPR-associated protein Cas7/Csh2 [Bacteroidales bacterium]
MSQDTIQHSSDFLFIYEASKCNPNGDPDQENKPRMDYDTKTNLVTDTRVKRFIRDYLKMINEEEVIFVDMEGDSKVSVESKLKAVVGRTIDDEEELQAAFKDNAEGLELYKEVIEEKNGDVEKVWETITDKKKYKSVNYELLAYLVKEKFIDIRMFGSAFAVGGFTKAYTGPIQLNWGYSLNKVELIDSDSIVTIMNDDSSTFGKDYRLHYSLLAFNGTINQHAAETTRLKKEDVETFRDALWKSIPASPTRSKLNQYPKLYVEIRYKDGVTNGQFGDLRNFVEATPKEGISSKQVRSFKDLEFDTSQLQALIEDNQDVIDDVIVRSAPDLSISL